MNNELDKIAKAADIILECVEVNKISPVDALSAMLSLLCSTLGSSGHTKGEMNAIFKDCVTKYWEDTAKKNGDLR